MQDKVNQILQMDCLEYLKLIPNNSVDLVLIDPPYNIKVAEWDKWKKQEDYINWLGTVFKECERVLKDNGSFYFWHNDFLQITKLQNYINKSTQFVFNSMISWVKPNFRNIAWKNKTENSNLRSWFNIQEYCLYYTFKDTGTGLNDIYSRKDCFKGIKDYLREQKALSKKTHTDFSKNYKIGKHTFAHYFKNNQWLFPTEENYNRMQEIAAGFFQKPYEELRKEYEELRKEYEELRPKFNIKNGSNINNVWYSKLSLNSGKNHICEKPLDLLMKIIETSSNKNDIILDCFMGSGSTALACLETGRNFLGCEIDPKYFEIANKRVKSLQADLLSHYKWLKDTEITDFQDNTYIKMTRKGADMLAIYSQNLSLAF